MYDRSRERDVFVASLPFMAAAKALGVSKGMNDHGPLHAQRVHSLVGHLSTLVKVSDHERDLLCAAALLHDIGMAMNREDHHLQSADLVRRLTAEGKLPFDPEECEVIATLCEWHRRGYDAEAVNSALGVRTGVLASLLRVADAMDLDYRRAEDYSKQESVISHIYQEQARHHLSVLNILGVRLYAGHLGNEVQVLVDEMSQASLQLARLVEELVGTPITWPVKLIPARGHSSGGDIFNSAKRAVVFSYCNAHGIVQAGMSKRALEMAGFTTTIVCNRDLTGWPPKFWKSILTGFDLADARLIAILGLDLPEDLDQFISLVRRSSGCRWIYGTPLDQPHDKISALLNEGVDVLIGDARLLFVGDALAEHASQLTRIAGLCNADDWLTSSGSFSRKEFQAARGLRYELLTLVEAKAGIDAYNALIDRVASGSIDHFVVQEKAWKSTLEGRMPPIERQGRAVILQECVMPGRFIYDLAHLAIEQQGVRSWEQNEFETPYAICRMPFKGDHQRVLYLSRFSRLEGAVPIKYFVSHTEHQLGSGATIWQTYNSQEEANEAVNATVHRINEFFSCKD